MCYSTIALQYLVMGLKKMLFKDRKGREWDVDINEGVAMRLKSSEGFDFYALEEDKSQGLKDLIGDKRGILSLVWKIVKPQAAANGVSEDDFFGSMGGTSSANARTAFIESYGNFTQSPAIRSWMKDQLILESENEKAQSRAMRKLMDLAQKESTRQAETVNDENIEKIFSEALSKPQGRQLAAT